MISIADGLLGREVDLGPVTVTPEMIAAYAGAVGDELTLKGPLIDAPPTFCLALHRGMRPEIDLPPDLFGVYGSHDLEFHRPIRAGETYRLTARISDVYEKSGRTGTLIVVVREAEILDSSGRLSARIVERQIIRKRPTTKRGNEATR